MRILIANDDGIYSQCIAELAEVAARCGDVRIVAAGVQLPSLGTVSVFSCATAVAIITPQATVPTNNRSFMSRLPSRA